MFFLNCEVSRKSGLSFYVPGTAWFWALDEVEMKQVTLSSGIVSCHAEEVIILCKKIRKKVDSLLIS